MRAACGRTYNLPAAQLLETIVALLATSERMNTVIVCNVAQLLKASTGTVRRLEIDELDPQLAADLNLVSSTKGSLRLTRTPAGILVTGGLSHQIESQCSRCLEPFVREQAIELNDEFVPVVDVVTGLPSARPDDPDAFTLTPDHMLDLGEAIRQFAILDDPLQPLCRIDCRGLCPRCGVNLNLGPCNCQQASAEEPQGVLGTLLMERMRQAGFQPEQE